jgi:hypothetical protein
MRGTAWRMAAGLGAVLALAACESTTEPVQATGDVRFTFSGDTAGSFVAVGAITRSNGQTGTYGAGTVQQAQQGPVLTVVGQRSTQEGTLDGVLVNVRSPAPGTFICAAETETCPVGVVYATNLADSDAAEPGTLFLSASASVTIAEIDSRRVRGTFTATLEEATAGAEPRTIQVTGSFDVPLLSEWAR